MQKIPFEDFGGQGPILHFAHANAYTPGCFRQILLPLTAQFHVVAIKHRPLWPGSKPEEMEDWGLIQEDLQRFFEQQGYQGVIGVGHSLGAVVTMMAAWRNPGLFRALVLIDPVFLPQKILQMAAEHPGAATSMPLVEVARRRRHVWPDRQFAFNNFRAKKVFSRWPDQSIWDYVNEGLQPTADGQVSLSYSREWEAQFYATPSVTVWQEIPRVPQPTLAIRGKESMTLTAESWQLWQELQPTAQFVEIPDAGHMIPMEQPQILVSLIQEYLESQDTTSGL